MTMIIVAITIKIIEAIVVIFILTMFISQPTFCQEIYEYIVIKVSR